MSKQNKTQKPTAVFASHINGIEFDVTDPVTAKLLRENSKADFIQEVGEDGEPIRAARNKGPSGGEVELD